MRRANPALIGGFIVGAVVLLIAGVIILGSGKFLTETITGVMYFEGAIQGLQVGAPVNFRGVKVGSVTNISMQFDTRNQMIRLPVLVEFPKGPSARMHMPHDGPKTLHDLLVALIKQGLRAQLQTESLVTGQLFIQLDIYPATSPEALPQEPSIDAATGRIEIPTVPTTLQEVSNTARRAIDKLAELPLEEMLYQFKGTLHGINQLVNAPEILALMRNLNTTLTDMQHLVRHADEQIQRVGVSATTTLGNFNQLSTRLQQVAQQTEQHIGHVAGGTTTTLGQVNQLTQAVDKQTLTLTTSLVQTAAAALNAVEHMREMLTAVQQMIAPNAPLGYELVKTLREFSETARSLRVLTEYLERHPNAVIFGRKEQGTP